MLGTEPRKTTGQRYRVATEGFSSLYDYWRRQAISARLAVSFRATPLAENLVAELRDER